NEKGEINFGSFAPGTYTLKEQIPPSGYHINEHEDTVVVAQDGMVTIDDMPVEYARIRDKKEQEQITVRKYVQRLEPERGVTFQLSQNNVMVACADTNEQGAYFHDMKPGIHVDTINT
ncbi:MAG: collagen binding domain-containing protein, partial [Acutalibacteraceae bacterium]